MLQRAVFPEDPAVAYLGKQARTERANRVTDAFVRRLLWSAERYWHEHGAGFAGELEGAAQELGRADRPGLVSHEDLLSACFGVLRVASRDEAGRHIGLDPDALARHMGAFAASAWPGRVRALVTVRRQDTIFAQTFLWRSATGPSTLERFIEEVTQSGFYSAGGLALDYPWLIECLERALGAANVDVLVYEDMAHDPARFADQLHTAVGIDRSRVQRDLAHPAWKVRSTDQTTWRVQRYRGSNPLRHLGVAAARVARGIPNPRAVSLTPELQRRVLELYREPNRRLEALLGRSLTAYGYC